MTRNWSNVDFKITLYKKKIEIQYKCYSYRNILNRSTIYIQTLSMMKLWPPSINYRTRRELIGWVRTERNLQKVRKLEKKRDGHIPHNNKQHMCNCNHSIVMSIIIYLPYFICIITSNIKRYVYLKQIYYECIGYWVGRRNILQIYNSHLFTSLYTKINLNS